MTWPRRLLVILGRVNPPLPVRAERAEREARRALRTQNTVQGSTRTPPERTRP